MIDIELVFRNYRCFGDEPTRLRISDGFTALVGVNNSGKSSLLRLLYEIRPLLNILARNQSGWTQGLMKGADIGAVWSPQLLGGERAFRADSENDIEMTFIVRDGPDGSVAISGEQLLLALHLLRDGRTTSELRDQSGTVLGQPGTPFNIGAQDFQPLLNAMSAAMGELADTMYVGPFRNAINIGAQQSYYDIQTGDAFVRAFAAYKSGPDPSQNEAVFQLIEELRRIFDFRSLDINAAPDGQTLQLTADGRSYRLTEQGAGLAHFIVVLVNVLIRRPSFLLIDEPELNLHASLQLDFLQTLAQYTRHGVIFATHSLGLARTAADRIYTLTRPPGGTSTVRLYEGDRELVTLLGQLSFDQRPELGFSKVLLVEGKSELRAIMQFLRFYHKEHDVLMLPLHGDDMIRPDVRQELAEVLRIGGEVHYLIDSERDAPGAPLSKNRQGFVDLCKELGIGGHVLERRALENYFTDDAIKRAFGQSTEALGLYGKKGDRQGWPKTNNWRAAAEMSRNDLDGTDLGNFLERL